MAVDIFLELDGIKGETQDKTYKSKGAMDVLSWSWGVSNTGTFQSGPGGGTGKSSSTDITIHKYVDLGSPTLMLFCSNGKHISKGVLTLRKAGENPVEYLKVTLTNVLVSSYQVGGSSGDERVTENLSLNFAQVKAEYAAQDEKGGKSGTNDYGWSFLENTKV